jgi:hypothetical protein
MSYGIPVRICIDGETPDEYLMFANQTHANYFMNRATRRDMESLERAKWPDPVLRIKDAMDMHAVAGGFGYVAFNLQTGEPLTGEGYPSRALARREAEKKTMDHLLILEIQPDGMPYKEADAVLRYERTLISAGVRTPDVFEDEQNSGLLSMPHRPHDRRRMASQLKRGKPLYPNGVDYSNLPWFLRKAN